MDTVMETTSRATLKQMGTVLKNCSLLNEEAAHKAFRAAIHTMRFERYIFFNDCYNYTANLVLFHGLSTLDRKQCDLSKEYVDETGVIVGGTNVLPMSAQETVLPEDIHCAATTIKAYVELIHIPTSQRKILPLPVWEIPTDQGEGAFWHVVGHKISETPVKTPKGKGPFEGLVFSVVDPQMLNLLK